MAAAYKKNRTRSGLVSESISVSYTSRIRAIGNSKGIILNNQAIKTAGISPEADIQVEATNGLITIFQKKESRVNTDLSTWGKQFRTAIKKGNKSDGDLFWGMENDFDAKEW